ncbi:unnamed protein product [Musa textilis]
MDRRCAPALMRRKMKSRWWRKGRGSGRCARTSLRSRSTPPCTSPRPPRLPPPSRALPHPARPPPPLWLPPLSRPLLPRPPRRCPLGRLPLFPRAGTTAPSPPWWPGPPSALVVFDGTWRQAKEMVAGCLPLLEQFATRVSLGGCEPGVEGSSTLESELVLRQEPFKGRVSTMEAVASALRVMEPDGKGAAVEVTLLSLLRAMVGFQARHLKPMKPRSK